MTGCHNPALTDETASLPRQVGSAWKKVIRLSVPNGLADKVKRVRTPGQAVGVIAPLKARSAAPARDRARQLDPDLTL